MKGGGIIKYLFCGLLVFGTFACLIGTASAEPSLIPNVSLNIGGTGSDQSGRASTLIQLLFILTVLSLAPAILLMMTSFTRIIVVLSLLRNALGTQQMPANQILIGLSLFLTFFIMTPVWQKVNENALKPYYEEEISGEQALDQAALPVKDFMLKQTREKDIALFVKIAREKRPEKAADVSLSVLIPAFIISELKTAFQIGFMIYLPFMVIDMVVSSVLLSMGMLMLPPIMMSLPFKLLLFVLVDGWYLIVGSLVQSFK
ncbi:MAG: flagellar type III secretion system pore protein FliP [Deltaproteobacteria bacterium]|jgi:flagellar biosynthetic protein FliP|nr:flagellar type III secretion system pore protein FliP [Deltaproteobacteria bacterium]